MCALYVTDNNQVCGWTESGTYATTLTSSGVPFWLGLVQSSEDEENINMKSVRYCGTSTRNVSKFVDTTIDVTGKFSMYPNDWRMLMYTLGSDYLTGSPNPYTHTVTEINSTNGFYATSGTKNSFPSFSVENVQRSSAGITKKLIKGAQVDELGISWSTDDFITCDVSYVAQSIDPTSGTKGTVTEPDSRPFMGFDVKCHLPSGTVMTGVKEGTITIKNNLEPKHYSNGSKEIEMCIPCARDYEISVTFDKDTTNDDLYQKYFQSGTEFNFMWQCTSCQRKC